MSAQVRPTDLPAPDDLARLLGSRLPAFQDVAWTASTGSTNADLLARARTGSGAGKPWLLGQVMHWFATGERRADPSLAEQYDLITF